MCRRIDSILPLQYSLYFGYTDKNSEYHSREVPRALQAIGGLRRMRALSRRNTELSVNSHFACKATNFGDVRHRNSALLRAHYALKLSTLLDPGLRPSASASAMGFDRNKSPLA